MILVACGETERTVPYESMLEKKATPSPDKQEKEATPTPTVTLAPKVQSKVVGKWIPYAIDYEGKKKQIKKIKKKIIEQVAKDDDNPAEAKQVLSKVFKDLEAFRIEFKDDATFVCKSNGNVIEGTWKEEEDSIIATAEKENIVFQFDGKELSIGSVGQGTYLKKE